MDNTLSHQERPRATVSHDSIPSLDILSAGMQIILLNTEKLKSLLASLQVREMFTCCLLKRQRGMQGERSRSWSR